MRFPPAPRRLLLPWLPIALLAGCGGKKAPPGAIDWTVRHDPTLQAQTDSGTDLRGALYACLFAKDPFAYPGQKVVSWRKLDHVNLNADNAMASGTQSDGSPAFPDLAVEKTYSLVLFLDDNAENLLDKCTNDQGEVQVFARDPIFKANNIAVQSMMVTTVDGVFDHRYSFP